MIRIGPEPDLDTIRIRLDIGVLMSYRRRSSWRTTIYWRAGARSRHTSRSDRSRHLRLLHCRSQRPSSLEFVVSSLYVWIPWRCCICSTKDEPHKQDVKDVINCMTLLLSTCSSPSRWFCYNCTSRGIPVIYDSNGSWVSRGENFASVAFPVSLHLLPYVCCSLTSVVYRMM